MIEMVQVCRGDTRELNADAETVEIPELNVESRWLLACDKT